MATKAVQPRHLWLYIGAVLLVLALCLGCGALLAALNALPWNSDSFLGVIAGVCVEWGQNWAGQPQVGLWWEAAHAGSVRPAIPASSSLQVHCALIPWSRTLPMRGTFIHTW
jgi:hypothetical protein